MNAPARCGRVASAPASSIPNATSDPAKDPLVRQRAYSALVAAGISDDDRDQLRRYTQQGRAWGSAAFQASVEQVLGHPAGLRHRGRQCK